MDGVEISVGLPGTLPLPWVGGRWWGRGGRDSTISPPVGNGVGGIRARDSVDPLRASPHVLVGLVLRWASTGRVAMAVESKKG
jgi:hypothetical protein